MFNKFWDGEQTPLSDIITLDGVQRDVMVMDCFVKYDLVLFIVQSVSICDETTVCCDSDRKASFNPKITSNGLLVAKQLAFFTISF